MRMLLPVLVCIVGLILFNFIGCDAGDIESEDNEISVNVVTTIYPLSDIIGELGGDKVKVSYLLPAGASPHTYEPTVEQARQVEEAHLFVHVGAGLDDWAVKLAEASGTDLVVIDLSKKVTLIEPVDYHHLGDDEKHDHDESFHDCDHADCDHDGCDHGPDDPHYWLDPIVVRDSICPAIYKQLVTIAPENEEYFKKRFSRYQQEITNLHEDITEATSSFSRTGFIAFHSAWQYFGQRYSLTEVAVIANFPGQEPSAGWVAELVEIINEEDIGAIFAEPQFPTALADRIAEESGSEVIIIDPLGGEGVPGRESYLDIMRFNLAFFKEAME